MLVYINDEVLPTSPTIQFKYFISNIENINYKKLEEIGVTNPRSGMANSFSDIAAVNQNQKTCYMDLNEEQKNKIQEWYPNAQFKKYEAVPDPQRPSSGVFPHDPKNFPDWTNDNFGPLVVPKKGATIKLEKETIALYRRIISNYEKNDLVENNGTFTINGQPATEYTFKQNYFWGMGDNRHASEDCRYFGFIPENHIVGKPLFIWFSTKNGNMGNGINWNRLFSGAYKM